MTAMVLSVKAALAAVTLLAAPALAASGQEVAIIPPRGVPMEQLVLATQGSTAYSIYLPPDSHPLEQRAARELADYLQQISGAALQYAAPDADPADGPLLVVGRSGSLADALCPQGAWDELGEEGFVIRTEGPHIVIAGNRPVGTLWGVYWLLDRHLGVRWFAQDCTVVPRRGHLTLPPLNERQVPRFAYREIFARDGDDEVYRAHNLLNGKSHHRRAQMSPADADCWSGEWADGGHNLHRTVPAAECGAGQEDCHAGGQLAMMDEEVRHLATAHLADRWMHKKPEEMTYLGFSQEDRGWSPDSLSAAFAAQHGGALSAPLLDMVIDVAGRVRKMHPDARLATLAYQWSFAPPTGMVIPPYVQVTLAPIHADMGQPLNGPRNRGIAHDIEAWSRISSNLVVWDYITNFGSYLQPHPNLESMCRTIQWLAGMPSIKGYFGQGAYGMLGAEFSQLRTWVAARLLWDPSQDGRALVDEFLDGYYGDAAPDIREYQDRIHAAVRETDTALTIRTQVTAPYLSFEVMHRADQIFAEAERAVVRRPELLARVRTARLGVDYVILLRRADYVAEAARRGVQWSPEFPERLSRFQVNARAAGVDQYGEGVGDLEELCAAMAIERRPPAVPALCTGLAEGDWVDFQDLSLRRYDRTQLVRDPRASDAGAIRMPGDTDIWGIQLRLDNLPPNATWDLYACVRIDPGTGSGSDPALRLGVHPPFGNERMVSVAELADGEYHVVALPGAQYRADAGRSLWVAPPGSGAVEAIYVDRVIALRHGASRASSCEGEETDEH